jgi:monofunctional chorismate mutase
MVTIRGAITCQNTSESIGEQAKKLVSEMMQKNNLANDDVLAVVFSATRDIDKANPATETRLGLGLDKTSFFCVQEMYVEGGLPNCLRVLMFTNKQIDKIDVYLDGASNLRK